MLEAVSDQAQALLLGPITAYVLVLVISLLSLYWFSTRNFNYWSKRGIPFVKPYPFVGCFLDNMKTPLHEVEISRYKKFGRIYGHFEGNKPMLSVADPTLLRDILVKDFHLFSSRREFETGDQIMDRMLSALTGEDWKRVRAIVTPTFSTGKIKRLMGIFNDCSRTLVNNFRKEEGNIDAKRVYGAFTMDIIASSAFSTKIDSHNDPDNPFVSTARRVFATTMNWRLLIFFTAPKLAKFLRMGIFDPTATRFFTSATLQIIEERNKTGQTRNDFLQLLLETAKENEKKELLEKEEEDLTLNYGEAPSIEHQVFKTATKKNLSMNELIAQCVIFFLAGYDTTASTLSFFSYNMALNQDVQDRARDEVDSVLAEHGGEVTYEAIQKMKYLDNLISETLRIFPPLSRLERQAKEDYKLGDTGITLPKGMIVTIPNSAMHIDPEFYPEPLKFDPERFEQEERSRRDQYTFLPFGAGPRNCVAMRFALVEVKVCLVHVLANFRIRTCPETKVPLEYTVGQGLLQPKGIILKLEERKDKPLLK